MNDADLARLNLAKRAYEAARPREAEVQTGVRRARLALRRPKASRKWLSKGLVLVVLAVGSLAYAKPHALGELVEQVLHPAASPGHGHASSGGGLPLPAPEARTFPQSAVQGAKPRSASDNQAATEAGDSESVAAPAAELAELGSSASAVNPSMEEREAGASEPSAPGAAGSQAAPRDSSRVAAGEHAGVRAVASNALGGSPAPVRSAAKGGKAPVSTKEADALSGWGRVGQALARGDEREALLSLNELAESDDPRTRDKADLGRAQLLLAHGNRDRACALARDLTQRHPGERVERQAQALLKSCSR